MFNLLFNSGLASVPALYFILRKRFNFSVWQTIFHSAFTLGFGLLSAKITVWLEVCMLDIASHGESTFTEDLRNYGIPMFLPIFYLIFCIIFKKSFRTLTDFLAPAVYSVMTFVKVACVFEGCCYGEPDPHGIMCLEGYKTFPVQLYDAISSLVILIICLVLIYTFAKKRPGYVYPIGGMLFALAKGYWESYRVHSTVWEKNFMDTGWTLWQFWMLALFIGCLIWLILTIVWDKKNKPDFDKR